jgi:5-(carboxyamino)imidazole ribonucleotide synthase
MAIRTIGIIGGGQLGRMLAMAASRLNFHTVILEPQADCPAAQLANRQIVAAYDDRAALEELARATDVVTYEFENVPVEAARFLAHLKPVYPPAQALEVAQDRLTEKTYLNACGIPTAGFAAVDSQEDLDRALSKFGGAGVLKTRRLGYDGKGQMLFRPGESAEGAFARLGGGQLILESFVAFEREISIIAARSPDGLIECYDPAENVHRSGILHTSTLPARISAEIAEQARAAALRLLTALEYVGVIGIEFFVTGDGKLIANEIAPRVHNSGHWTEAACVISQFEQHVRAITGLPLGAPDRHSDCVMQNLIGDDISDVESWAREKDVLIHLYGKAEPRPGRKMGHITRLTGRV